MTQYYLALEFMLGNSGTKLPVRCMLGRRVDFEGLANWLPTLPLCSAPMYYCLPQNDHTISSEFRHKNQKLYCMSMTLDPEKKMLKPLLITILAIHYTAPCCVGLKLEEKFLKNHIRTDINSARQQKRADINLGLQFFSTQTNLV